MNYQVVAQDGSGNPINTLPVCLRFTIRTGSGGPILYQETQQPTTNSFGLFTAKIGMGVVVNGTFNTIP
jgi:hypothetical protein